MGAQRELFFTTYYDAITTWGSVSAGELLLLTASNGGVNVSNDVFSPYVTSVPGVEGTGGMFGKSAITSLGMVYMRPDGVYLWDGGQSSQIISSQLAYQFWLCSTSPFINANIFQVQHWNRWIAVPGNWIFDQDLNSWWIMNDPNIMSEVSYWNAYYERANVEADSVLVAAPYATSAALPAELIYYTRTACASNWRYTTNLFQVVYGAVADIAEVVITAANIGSESYTIVPKLLLLDDTEVTLDTITVPGSTNKLTQYRLRTRCITDMVQIQLNVACGGSDIDGQNFMIGSVAIGYESRWHVAVT